MAEWRGVDCQRNDGGHVALEPKHKIFLSHSGAEKQFVEYLCDELRRCLRYPFFDLLEDSLPIGEKFPPRIFAAIRQCYVGVVILSENFVTSKWPMTELVAMQEESERRSDFKLIPVFLRTPVAEFADPGKLKQWQECWNGLALKSPERVEVGKWEAALKYIRGVNGLVKSGQRDTQFVKEIVDRVCALVPAEMKVEDSHIQGRARLCKVIRDRIELLLEKGSGGVCKVGLYGVGGMGKTTMCKALCNELFTEFRGRVCHAELERLSEEELLRDVLKGLSDARKEATDRCNLGQLQNGLKEGSFIRDAVFLAVDNVSDADELLMEANKYLKARLPPGSIVMVTTRYRESLARLGLDVDGDECMEMPELESEEARCLFLTSCGGRNGGDEQLIERCIKRCRFWKGDSGMSYYYIPLALDVLGRELARLEDPKEWEAQLEMIDKDVFNQSNESEHHPIFSVLRRSFDALPVPDKLLFVDVALFLPLCNLFIDVNISKWLGMVHGIGRLEDVRYRLELLKKKSLLESYGDGRDARSFRMHDLWRAFCVVETKCGELKGRRWVYEKGTCSESSPCETYPRGNCWEKVKRMAFLEFRSWRGVNFAHFPNVSVLMIRGAKFTEELVVDLSGLLCLRSLEIFASSVFVHGLPRGLIFLRLDGDLVVDADGAIAAEIEGLKELQCLQLIRYDGCKLPDIASMSSLLMASFSLCRNVIALNGLSSTLRILLLNDCYELRSCVGVGNLVALEEFFCNNCLKLEVLPNLGRLRRLRILEIGWCGLISEVPGLGDLEALEELRATDCEKLLRLSDMRKLVKLRVLELEGCESITEMLGVDMLISLEVVEADFRAMVDMPNLGQLTKLRKAYIDGWNSAGVQGLSNLKMLRILRIGYCTGADELPDLRNLTQLQDVTIESSEFKDVSGLSHLSSLESLWIYECAELERLPTWHRLASLRSLKIADCPKLIWWDSMTVEQVEQVEGKLSPLEDDSVCGDVPNTGLEWNLEILELSNCESYELRTFGSFLQLESLYIQYSAVTELPDLSDFPRLRSLGVWNCERFQRLVNSVPTQSLRTLDMDGCGSLSTLPDFCKEYPGLSTLVFRRCHGIASLSTSGPMTALTALTVDSCNSLTAVPDLAMFVVLEKLKVDGSSKLKELSSSEPLIALKSFKVISCTALTTVPDLAMFSSLEVLDLNGCSELEALSSNVALAALTRLEVTSCQALMAVPDLGMFPALKNLDVYGCSKLKELSSSEPLFALRSFKVKSCTALTTVPDLAMFPALEALDLNGCSELEALSNTMPSALRKVDIRGCDRLSRDDASLQVLSPQCEMQWDKEQGDVGKSCRFPLLGLCGAILDIGIVVFTWRKKSG